MTTGWIILSIIFIVLGIGLLILYLIAMIIRSDDDWEGPLPR
jgi:hypothetical protein